MGRFRDRSLMERVFNFVIEVLKLVEKLPRNKRNMIVGDQLTRSATSTGANLEEADGAISRREFVKFVNTAKRAMKESNYWLRNLTGFREQSGNRYRRSIEGIGRVNENILLHSKEKRRESRLRLSALGFSAFGFMCPALCPQPERR